MSGTFTKKYNNTYTKGTKAPFKLSRSKIDLYMECPRCFYLDRRLGIGKPSLPGFTLNVAVDALLKKEFDNYREKQKSHPLTEVYGLDVVPFKHDMMETWRANFTGIQHVHTPTNFLIFGAVDDIWINKDGELIVVDYKATSKAGKMESLSDTKWERQYRRQMDIYQWLLRQNNFNVSSTGYFLYANGKKDEQEFNGSLFFDVTLIPYEGDDSWVEDTLISIKECLEADEIPEKDPECEYCTYVDTARNALGKQTKEGSGKTLF